jgi:hypothetical protein
MKFTNTHGLPQAVVEALIGDEFNLPKLPKNLFWATRLISPPKIAQLELRHWGEMECDVSDRFNRVLGTALHEHIRRNSNDANRLTEEKAYIDTDKWEVKTLPPGESLRRQSWHNPDVIYVSAKLDSYELLEGRGIIDDYKTGKTFQVIIDGQPKQDWIRQNNIYAFVLRKIGFPVHEIRNTFFMVDWMKSKTKTDHRYPQIPIHIFGNQPIWTDQEVISYLESRIRLHVAAMTIGEDDIPECTEEERWARPPVFAVMKTGRKTSLKNHDNRISAEKHAADMGAGHYVEARPGVNTRCETYCSCAQWCHFWKKNCAGKTSIVSEE